MNDPKGWLQSTTIWGVLVFIAPLISQWLGFDFGATLDDILQVAGLVGIIVGRFTARKPLSIKPFVRQ